MTQKYKIKILFLAVGFFVFFAPQALAASAFGVGTSCISAANCDTGLICDNTNKCAQPSYQSACNSSAADPCNTASTGLACISGQCLVPDPNITVPSPTAPNLPQSTIPTLPAANGSNTFCPDGLSYSNGLCLPAASNFPNTGLAGQTTLSGLLLNIIQILLSFAGIIAVVMLVLGGYWYMAAGGNEEQAEKGKNTIVNFVLGLVVILLAYAIVTIISNTLTSTKLTN